MMTPAKKRLDQLLVERGLAASWAQAQGLILAGQVWVRDQAVTKPGHNFANDIPITLQGPSHPYVSRGGEKLAHALEIFALSPQGQSCLDIGASTGGFTDCLLQAGASRVIALDVGHGQLDWKLRQDPHVIVMEKTNVRYLRLADLLHPVSLITIDVAFISLRRVIPVLPPLLIPPAQVVALVKPQFEVKRHEVGKKGVVRDPQLHHRVVAEIRATFELAGFVIRGETPSPLKGPEGNEEFFLWAQKILN